MKNVINELKVSSILTKEEIVRIKSYVVKKYPNNSFEENASILSRTIYGIIDKNLEGINGEERQIIKKNIIESTILKDKKNILKWDVFNAYIRQLQENPQLKTSLMLWINKNQKSDVTLEILEEYVISIHNRSDTYNLNLDIKSPLNEKYVKYNILWLYNNLKNVIIKYKNKALSRINCISQKIKIILESITNKISSTKIALSLLTLLVLSLYSLNNPITDSNINMFINKFKNKNINQSQLSNPIIDTVDLYTKDVKSYHPNLPDYFNYKSIDKGKLLEFLNKRDSMLAEEPYFSAIIRASVEFNLNPHILFAITGQEQAFVPKSNENAIKIANNPFNVFNSWQKYNTDIYDSSTIAARTVINLANDKPVNVDIFDWINNKYAYDKNWGKGVKAIFETLSE